MADGAACGRLREENRRLRARNDEVRELETWILKSEDVVDVVVHICNGG